MMWETCALIPHHHLLPDWTNMVVTSSLADRVLLPPPLRWLDESPGPRQNLRISTLTLWGKCVCVLHLKRLIRRLSWRHLENVALTGRTGAFVGGRLSAVDIYWFFWIHTSLWILSPVHYHSDSFVQQDWLDHLGSEDKDVGQVCLWFLIISCHTQSRNLAHFDKTLSCV